MLVGGSGLIKEVAVAGEFGVCLGAGLCPVFFRRYAIGREAGGYAGLDRDITSGHHPLVQPGSFGLPRGLRPAATRAYFPVLGVVVGCLHGCRYRGLAALLCRLGPLQVLTALDPHLRASGAWVAWMT